MKRSTNAALVLAALLAGPTPGQAQTCDLTSVKGSVELHETLTRRIVDALSRASTPTWASDQRLKALVAETAEIGLGAGDVGRPQGVGPAGVRKLAETMHADSYRVLGWDYMDLPAKPCGPNDLSVSFVDAGQSSVSDVKFSFENGRIVRAEGWQRTFKAGPIPKVR